MKRYSYIIYSIVLLILVSTGCRTSDSQSHRDASVEAAAHSEERQVSIYKIGKEKVHCFVLIKQ